MQAIRYVALHGNDAYDGLSWSSPKRTVRGANDSLPDENIHSGGQVVGSRKVGVIYVGLGEFVENVLPCVDLTSNIRVVGQGTGRTGTRIKAGVDATLMATMTDVENRYIHGVSLENMTLDGGGFDSDILKIYRGGFNAQMLNVHIKSSGGAGLRLIERCINFSAYNIGFSDCNPAMSFDLTENLVSVGVTGAQIDNCGPSPIQINYNYVGYDFPAQMLSFRDITFEGHVDGCHLRCFDITPNGTAPLSIHIDGAWSRNWPNPGGYLVYEQAGTGERTRMLLTNVGVDDKYAGIFKSDKTGDVRNSRLVMLEEI